MQETPTSVPTVVHHPARSVDTFRENTARWAASLAQTRLAVPLDALADQQPVKEARRTVGLESQPSQKRVHMSLEQRHWELALDLALPLCEVNTRSAGTPLSTTLPTQDRSLGTNDRLLRPSSEDLRPGVEKERVIAQEFVRHARRQMSLRLAPLADPGWNATPVSVLLVHLSMPTAEAQQSEY